MSAFVVTKTIMRILNFRLFQFRTVFYICATFLFLSFEVYADQCLPNNGDILQVRSVPLNDTLNVRSGPSTQYPTLYKLPSNSANIKYQGAKFQTKLCEVLCNASDVDEEIDNKLIQNCINTSQIWYQVSWGSEGVGWASGKYLEKVEKNYTNVNKDRTWQIADGQCAIIAAAFTNLDAAISHAKKFKAPSKPLILKATNGFYSSSYGIFDDVYARSILPGLINDNTLPSDAYCSNSPRYVEIFELAAFDEVSAIKSDTNINKVSACENSPSECSIFELCEKASYKDPSGRKYWRTEKSFEPFVSTAVSIGVNCGVQVTPDNIAPIQIIDNAIIKKQKYPNRKALVVGNANYVDQVPLSNPIKDAKAIAAALKKVGFEVTYKEDLDYREFGRALADFERGLSGTDFSLFYFAGHGIEVDKQNYLIPIDAELRSPEDARYETVTLDDVIAASLQTGKLSLVLIDACRDNPFSQKMEFGKRSIRRGLSPVEVQLGQVNQVISFAAASGKFAEDGAGENSPYATALIDLIEKPGLEIGKLFRQLGERVSDMTGGRQQPEKRDNLRGEELFFVYPINNSLQEKTPYVPSDLDKQCEQLFDWSQASRQCYAVDAYLKTCPDHVLRPIAENFNEEFCDDTNSLNTANSVLKGEETLISDLNLESINFIKSLNDVWSGRTQNDPSNVANFYADYVNFYGKIFNNAEINTEKIKFSERWPVRSYVLDIENTHSECSEVGECNVIAEVRWRAESPVELRVASGKSRFEYVVKKTSGRFYIISETAAAIKTDNGINVVEKFYKALARGDGRAAVMFVVPEKRETGAYKSDGISKFYGNLIEPLNIKSLVEINPNLFEVKYNYKDQGRICDGVSSVTTTEIDDKIYIKKIVAKNGC